METIVLLSAALASAAPGVEPPPAAYYDNAVAAATVAAEYDFIDGQSCPCGGRFIAWDHVTTYDADGILEAVLTRCNSCREDRPFYFDLTPRYGTLTAFRENLLATRAYAGPAAEDPCPNVDSAVRVDSIAEEYIFLETTAHGCGEFYVAGDQALQEEGGEYYDVLQATCPADGAETSFYFDINSFFGDFENYPEFEHTRRYGTPPAPLTGRALTAPLVVETAADVDARVGEERHAADGGALKIFESGTRDGNAGPVYVRDTYCEKCLAPVRLFYSLAIR